MRYDVPFNFSRINNYAVERTTGRYLLFLNNDTEVLVPDWIEAMVEQAQRPSVGAVGAKLLYPDGTIQHAGVVLRIGGVAGHSHKYVDGAAHGYFNMLRTVNNYSAVTGACMMIRRDVFEAAGGFDEALAVAFNDVDLCLRLRAAGLYNVYLPHVVLYHHESKSRGHENTPDKQARFTQESLLMQRRWRTSEIDDPHYSPHLSVTTEDYAIRL
jgi:GT2 family glycosyltransferase